MCAPLYSGFMCVKVFFEHALWHSRPKKCLLLKTINTFRHSAQIPRRTHNLHNGITSIIETTRYAKRRHSFCYAPYREKYCNCIFYNRKQLVLILHSTNVFVFHLNVACKNANSLFPTASSNYLETTCSKIENHRI